MPSLCTGCSMAQWEVIALFYEDDEGANQFFKDHEVLPSSVKCPYCNQLCSYRETRGIWWCKTQKKIPKKKNKYRKCGFSISERKGTFLQGLKFNPWKLLLFIAHWTSNPKHFHHKTIYDNLQLSGLTSLNWRKYCTEVYQYWCESQESGPGVNVDMPWPIDKTKFGLHEFLVTAARLYPHESRVIHPGLRPATSRSNFNDPRPTTIKVEPNNLQPSIIKVEPDDFQPSTFKVEPNDLRSFTIKEEPEDLQSFTIKEEPVDLQPCTSTTSDQDCGDNKLI